jgi:hypothetical protein
LEFAIGTGRVALPLRARGIAVQGIELSPHMAGQMLAKPGADAVAVGQGPVGGGDQAPFASDSYSQVAVFEKLP